MSNNQYGQLEALLADTIDRIVDIDDRTKAHSLILQEFVGFAHSLQVLNVNTSSNTAAIAALNTTMQDVRSVMIRYQEADLEKWNVATGKRHVPLLTHYLTVATLCFVILGGFFAWLRIDLVTKHFELRNSVIDAQRVTQGQIDQVEKEIKTLGKGKLEE